MNLDVTVGPLQKKPGREQHVRGLPIRPSRFYTLLTTISVLRTSHIPRSIFFEGGNYSACHNSGRSTLLYAAQSEEIINALFCVLLKHSSSAFYK